VRVVTVPGLLVDALAAHRKIQDRFRRPVRLLFAEPEGNMLKDSTSSAASALCRRLKLPKGVSLHTLRHIHGSHLLAAGMEITAVSERLGHFSARVTQNVYSHTFPGRDHDARGGGSSSISRPNSRKWFSEGIDLPQRLTASDDRGCPPFGDVTQRSRQQKTARRPRWHCHNGGI
jgi:hypothetical protein